MARYDIPGYTGNDDCESCGTDVPCFDHYQPCPNGRLDCDGMDCRRCQRATVAPRPNTVA